jgi:predicted RNA-binding Zn-ribbon protein involved in translation (DUF1610 family)
MDINREIGAKRVLTIVMAVAFLIDMIMVGYGYDGFRPMWLTGGSGAILALIICFMLPVVFVGIVEIFKVNSVLFRLPLLLTAVYWIVATIFMLIALVSSLLSVSGYSPLYSISLIFGYFALIFLFGMYALSCLLVCANPTGQAAKKYLYITYVAAIIAITINVLVFIASAVTYGYYSAEQIVGEVFHGIATDVGFICALLIITKDCKIKRGMAQGNLPVTTAMQDFTKAKNEIQEFFTPKQTYPQNSTGAYTMNNAQPTVFCTSCGAPVAADALFCVNCGAQVIHNNKPVDASASINLDKQRIEVCIACGEPLEADSVFCTKCGHKIGE